MNFVLTLSRFAVVVGFALSLSGCLISVGSSSITNTGANTNYRVNFTATLTTCVPTPFAPDGSTVSCRLQLSTGQTWNITVNLPGIAPSSLPTLFDPLILQIPMSAGTFSGTITGPGGGSLSVTPVTGTLFADAVTPIVAEAGQQLVLVDFAPGASLVSGSSYDFQLDFSIPNPPPTSVDVKLLFAGKVVTGTPATGAIDPKAVTTYYPPLLPCSANFASIPAITLRAGFPINPLPLATAQACNNVTYNFGVAPPPASTVTVVEFYNQSLDHYFITWVAAEIAGLDAGTTARGWTRTGKTFKAYATSQPGTTDICRIYIIPLRGDSHFFGRGTDECNGTMAAHPDFIMEEPKFMAMFLPVVGVCPAGTVAVYRVFSGRADANHRYMIDAAVRTTMVALGWIIEGDGPDSVVLCAPA